MGLKQDIYGNSAVIHTAASKLFQAGYGSATIAAGNSQIVLERLLLNAQHVVVFEQESQQEAADR